MPNGAMVALSTYRRRTPETTVLHQVLLEHWPTYVAQAEADGRFVRGYVHRRVEAFIQCGCLAAGFFRLRCPTCNTTRLLAFSCKSRGLCPSCDGRRMADSAAHLVDRVLPIAPCRQWVLSCPFSIRARLASDNEALTLVLTIFLRAVFTWLRRAAHEDGIDSEAIVEPGAVTLIQRFGDAIRLSPHLHAVVTEGVFVIDDLARPPRFHRTRAPMDADLAQLAATLERRVTRALDRLDSRTRSSPSSAAAAVEPEVTAALTLSELPGLGPLRHKTRTAGAKGTGNNSGEADRQRPALCADVAGFNVHAATFVAQDDRPALERLLRYVNRPAIPEDRLTLQDDGRVLLQLKRRWSDGTESLVLEPLDFVRRAVALIPPPRANLTRYHGVVAPGSTLRSEVVPTRRPDARRHPKDHHRQSAHQGHRHRHRHRHRRERTGGPGPDAPDVRPLMRDRCLKWAPLMARTFALDVLQCPACSGRLEVVSVITSRSVAERILRHLGLPHELPRPSPARGPPQLDLDFDLGVDVRAEAEVASDPGPGEAESYHADGGPFVAYDEYRERAVRKERDLPRPNAPPPAAPSRSRRDLSLAARKASAGPREEGLRTARLGSDSTSTTPRPSANPCR